MLVDVNFIFFFYVYRLIIINKETNIEKFFNYFNFLINIFIMCEHTHYKLFQEIWKRKN